MTSRLIRVTVTALHRQPVAGVRRSPAGPAPVLTARRISGDLTLLMCAPMSDGAAAAVLTTPETAQRWGAEPVRLLATVIGAGRAGVYGELVPRTAERAFCDGGP